ncbi:MAG: aspartate-semialdehyde dehydrogenase [Zestosphaera sp.]
MKKRVAVLGATGLVGQRFVTLLANHPWFELTTLTASEGSVGRRYVDVVRWLVEKPIPEELCNVTLAALNADALVRDGVEIAFSALPTEVARKVEVELARKGVVVISNASSMRLEPDIPLVNPEVNADHLGVIEQQRRIRSWDGALIKIPNCTTAILTLSLKPLMDEFGVNVVIASSMQAVSGAGLSGLPSMLIIDNLIPYIEGEEEKIESESRKILGSLGHRSIELSDVIISTSCHRVMVLEGHTIAVFAGLRRDSSPEEVLRAMSEFRTNKIKDLKLPTAPERPIVIRNEPDRPQPRLDRLEGGGMSVVVGRVRGDAALRGVKYEVLGHNTVRGAAGTGVLIAEVIKERNLI